MLVDIMSPLHVPRDPMDVSHPGSHEFHAELGRLITASALVESELESIIRWMLEADQRGAEIVTATMDFRRKLDVVQALIADYKSDDADYQKIAAVCRECHALYNERNSFVHGMWQQGKLQNRRSLALASTKGGAFRVTFKDIAPDDIRRLADKFLDCWKRIDTALINSLL
jgi:hypothetical protein